MPLFTEGYKSEPPNYYGDNLTKCWEVTCDGLASHPGGVEMILRSRFVLRKLEISAGTDESSGSPNYDWRRFTSLNRLKCNIDYITCPRVWVRILSSGVQLEISRLRAEDKIRIHKRACNILFIIQTPICERRLNPRDAVMLFSYWPKLKKP